MTELNELLAENDVELSEDALEAVAGGCGGNCPNGGEHDWAIYNTYQECKKCGEIRYFY